MIEARDRDAEIRSFQRTYGMFGEAERRTFKHAVSETRKAGTVQSGATDGSLQVVGHAAVFDKPSVEMRSNLGIFTEYIDPSAFDKVLRSGPDVLLTWDHDTRYVLGRTANDTLELSVDPVGLRYWSKVADTSYARDLQVLMEGGYLDQSSFLFRIAPGGEEWTLYEDEDGNEVIQRRIYEVGELFDVCVCAAGAYPDTSSGVARTLAHEYATSRGYLKTVQKYTQEQVLDEFRALGDVAWGPEEGYWEAIEEIERQLNKGSFYCLWSVVDMATDQSKVLVCNWDDYTYWVVPVTMGDDGLTVADNAEWVQVESAWVTTAEGYDERSQSAKDRREARMSDTDETVEVETTDEVVEAEPIDEVPVDPEPVTDTETEAAASEEPEASVEDEPRTVDAVKARLLAEAQARIARAKSL